MTTVLLVAGAWVALSIPVALAIGRLSRDTARPPVPVDRWSDERIDDEFMALVAELEWRQA